MCIGRFLIADKRKLEMYLPEIFQILHSNMSLIAPTNSSYDADYEIWCSYIIPAMQKEQRQIVLMYVESKLVGYFQFSVNNATSSLLMEEIQIKKDFQGTGLFSEFYKWFVKYLPKNFINVEAHADKRNYKSQNILKHLGLVETGENKNGISLRFKGKYVDLLNKYS